jgi:hypothetical protein
LAAYFEKAVEVRHMINKMGVLMRSSAIIAGLCLSYQAPMLEAMKSGTGYSSDWLAIQNSSPLRLGYSTLLGGDFSTSNAITVDSQGNTYVLGDTDSLPFLKHTRIVRTSRSGVPGSTFVTKLNRRGDLVYSTVLTGRYFGSGIAVDQEDNVYISGNTGSGGDDGDLVATPGAFQKSRRGGNEAIVIKLNRAGNGIVYATYFGGGGDDYITDIAVDPSGNAYVTGQTNSFDFPTTPSAYRAAAGSDAKRFSNYFVSKLGPDGSRLMFSTCFGGTEYDDNLRGFPTRPSKLAVDPAGNVYIGGSIQYEHYYFDPARGRSAIVSKENRIPTTQGVFQAGYKGDNDAFIVKLDSTGSKVIFSTYLGGSKGDDISGLALDRDGHIYVTGNTYSSDFPRTAKAFQSSASYDPDDGRLNRVNAFVTKLSSTGNTLLYSTYLGGNADVYCSGLVLDTEGNAYVTGVTRGEFPVTANAFQKKFNERRRLFDPHALIEDPHKHVFLSVLNATGSGLLYSTYLGGDYDDVPTGIATDGVGGFYITGDTTSQKFPLTPSAIRTKITKIRTAFVTRFNY